VLIVERQGIGVTRDLSQRVALGHQGLDGQLRAAQRHATSLRIAGPRFVPSGAA
jgi:hypothetical protein